MDPGTHYLAVFRFVGTVAFMAHGFAVIPEAIWFGRPWGVTIKFLFDAGGIQPVFANFDFQSI